MFKEECIIAVALCCILVFMPMSYFMNVYQWANFIHPADTLLNFIKSLPIIPLTAVLFYGAYDVAKLIQNGKSKYAGRFALVLVALLVVAFVVIFFTSNLGIRFEL